MNVSTAETSRPPISAAIICLNEAAIIGRCLDALAWCEDVVVVDSGSTDETLEIVQRHPHTRVFHRRFDSYVNQKNYALDQCRHDWVLSVDADEVLSPLLIEEIGALPFDAAGYEIAIRPFLGGQEIKHGTWNPGYKLRLFRRTCGRWGSCNPHERVVLDGRTRRLKNRILHYSYQNRQEFLDRNRHYTRLMVDHLMQQGRKTFFGEPALHWFGNFVKSYVVRRGFLDGATGLFLAYHIANFSYMKYSLLAKGPRRPRTPRLEKTPDSRRDAA